ncbi:MAG: phosphoribosyl-AMP cyclohydrolase [Candidatus Lokiarchaeota archaeon]|nr:phosphoribosyl-AMP cyclohydrolase [Candidatus Lokiarchaeota archaeon]MBD3200089.1 phosphoribosyl-AMP cyclohydrolase [Candidatus Lokiarchaeota archaeon]
MKKYNDKDVDNFINILDFSKIKGELVPVVAQDYKTNEILMLAFANEIAVRKTLETGYAHYYSRSRDTLWKKGGTSGHIQEVRNVIIDCDNDSILLKVKQVGAPCHKGFSTCFFNEYENGGEMKLVGKKEFDPKDVYKTIE